MAFVDFRVEAVSVQTPLPNGAVNFFSQVHLVRDVGGGATEDLEVHIHI